MTQGKRQAGSCYLTVCGNKEHGLVSPRRYEKVGGNHILYNQMWEPFPSILISREKGGLVGSQGRVSQLLTPVDHMGFNILTIGGRAWVTQKH